ncbi:MAG: hypothetical protein JWM19_958 [Actinomycetia bacterium]|nr:hypothetical protein [Actinomycetes bacterium]
MPLSHAEAADLYKSGQSACQIAAANKLTKLGVEGILRKSGLGGLQWCPIHHYLEVL